MTLRNPLVVMKDIGKLAENTDGIFLINSADMKNIEVAIQGPDGPFSSGIFHLKLGLPQDYPFEAPKVVFTTRVFHPNVGPRGKVCMDRLAETWKPSIPLKHVCVMVQRLLAEPNPESPLNTDAARMLSNDPEMYDRTVLMWVKTHAQGVYSYPPFDQKLEDLSMKCGDIEQALQLLTNTYWVYDDAVSRLL